MAGREISAAKGLTGLSPVFMYAVEASALVHHVHWSDLVQQEHHVLLCKTCHVSDLELMVWSKFLPAKASRACVKSRGDLLQCLSRLMWPRQRHL